MIKALRNINLHERAIFNKQLLYSTTEGLIKGCLLLNEFVFIKGMKGTDFQLSILFQFSMVVFVFAFIINQFERSIANKKKLIRITAVVSRLPLFSLIAMHFSAHGNYQPFHHYWFLSVFLIYYCANPIILPILNQMMKANYEPQNFSKLFGLGQTVQKAFTLTATFCFGFLLDAHPNIFLWIYPILGFFSIVSFFNISTISFTNTIEEKAKSFGKMVSDAVRQTGSILRNNVPFRDMTIGFMLYGFAWMSTHAVITIFYERALGLKYSDVALYKNIFDIVPIFMLPFFGRLLPKLRPHKFAVMTFSFFLLYILFTAITYYYPINTTFLGYKVYLFLFIAAIFYGLFQSAQPMIWGIGSSYFCKPEEAGQYQSVHLTFVGIRALFSPIIGILVLHRMGYMTVFALAALLLICAIVWMYRSHKLHYRSM